MTKNRTDARTLELSQAMDETAAWANSRQPTGEVFPARTCRVGAGKQGS